MHAEGLGVVAERLNSKGVARVGGIKFRLADEAVSRQDVCSALTPTSRHIKPPLPSNVYQLLSSSVTRSPSRVHSTSRTTTCSALWPCLCNRLAMSLQPVATCMKDVTSSSFKLTRLISHPTDALNFVHLTLSLPQRAAQIYWTLVVALEQDLTRAVALWKNAIPALPSPSKPRLSLLTCIIAYPHVAATSVPPRVSRSTVRKQKR